MIIDDYSSYQVSLCLQLFKFKLCGSFRFNLDGPIANGGDDVGACVYPSRFSPHGRWGWILMAWRKGSVMIFFAMFFAFILLVDANALRS